MQDINTQESLQKSESDVALPLKARLLLKLSGAILDNISGGKLAIIWPGGARSCHGEGADTVTLTLRNYKPFVSLLRSGHIGFAESYLQGDWYASNLLGFFKLIHKNESRFSDQLAGGVLARVLNTLAHYAKKNSKSGSQKNIAYHYDLGNEFYQLWLDSTMTYSSAYFKQEDDDLRTAQLNKLELITDWLQVEKDNHVLEIGCGWGALSRKLALKIPCEIKAISLSERQLEFARDSRDVLTNGSGPVVSDKTDLANISYDYIDYRDVSGRFDRIVSIEMFEAVGEAYWETYFRQLSSLLTEEGSAVLQVITIDEENFDGYRKNPDFIQRYIFPGGMLPTKTILNKLARDFGFRISRETWFGQSYARTLACWHQNFEDKLDKVRAAGHDDRFIQMWRYYLAYCETGFSMGTTDVGLIKLEKV